MGLKAFFEELKAYECAEWLEVNEKEVTDYAHQLERATKTFTYGMESSCVFLANDGSKVIKCRTLESGLARSLLWHNCIFGNPIKGRVGFKSEKPETDSSREKPETDSSLSAIFGAIQAYRREKTFGVPTPYVVEGWVCLKSSPYIVLSQPYVDLEEATTENGTRARELLTKDLCDAFKCEVCEPATITGDWFIETRDGYLLLDDLKDANIGIDRVTGRYAVVDCIIREEESITDFGGALCVGTEGVLGKRRFKKKMESSIIG